MSGIQRAVLVGTGLIVLFLGAMLGAQRFARTQSVQAQTPVPSETPRTLTLTATGRVTRAPEVAWVSLGVYTEADTAKDAVRRNSDLARQVIQALRNLGIAEADIRTTQYQVFLREEYDRQGNVVRRYYAVEEGFQVTVRDLNQVGAVLDAAVQAGANRVYNVRFGVEDENALLREARVLAVQEAQRQAEAVAQAAGVTLVGIQSISFGSETRPVPILKAAPTQAEAVSVPVEPGTLEYSATVTVVFLIK